MNKRFFSYTAPFALSVLVLAGCAVGPTYTAPADAPVAISAPERSLFANDAVQRDWWRQLDDAQLDALIER
ncbi:RND transporter, partial [Variovorax sp. KBW07]